MEIGWKLVFNGCFADRVGDGGAGAGAILFETELRGVVEMPALLIDELNERL